MMKKKDKIEENDIEDEKGNEDVKNENPFDPSDISVSIVPRTIGQLVDMMEDTNILIPEYQRLPNLWDDKKKSRFIESLMLNLPIPLFYFDEVDKKTWKVIDGLQRMSTLEHFILIGNEEYNCTISDDKKPFVLDNLEFRTEFNGKTWKELPRDVQRRIATNQVTINLIGKGTPEEVKYNIFSRINQGGIELTAQEIRTALFQGDKINFIKHLVSSDTDAGKSFGKATGNSISSKRQEDLDFASRFISFYILGPQKYEPDMDSFLVSGTKSIPQEVSKQKEILCSFQQSMNLSFEIFGENTFRKISQSTKRSKINKSLFEVISVCFARLTQIERTRLSKKKKRFDTAFKELQQKEEFLNAISVGTAAKESVKIRHESFKKLIDSFIK